MYRPDHQGSANKSAEGSDAFPTLYRALLDRRDPSLSFTIILTLHSAPVSMPDCRH